VKRLAVIRQPFAVFNSGFVYLAIRLVGFVMKTVLEASG
jgi:hypothetical protein